MIVFAGEVPGGGEREILASFRVNPIFDGNAVLIPLSELSKSSLLEFSYDRAKDMLYTSDGKYGIAIGELDENADINTNGIYINEPYRFKVFMSISLLNGQAVSGNNLLDPQHYFGGKDNASAVAEANLEFDSGYVKLVLEKTGTSLQLVEAGSIGNFLNHELILVNKGNTLDRSYIPPRLVYKKPVKARTSINAALDRKAMEQLDSMLGAAYNEGVSGAVITSAYRTFEKQTSLFNNKTSLLSRKMNRKTAMEEASKVVALPGASEHQTGLAVDISSEGMGLVRNFADTTQGKWLANNSWKFGFVVRYPGDKSGITGIIFEPWHIRYVGNGHAEIMKARNLCLEEYVDYLRSNGITYFRDSKGDDYLIRYIMKEELKSGEGMALSLTEGSDWSISECTKDSYILTIKL
ncbi:MAG TPA: M15 family metallopeptidase, partial [Negativicutes bacterium]|nr:M15 family metallopeptidase [Negativicutes bacterium]